MFKPMLGSGFLLLFSFIFNDGINAFSPCFRLPAKTYSARYKSSLSILYANVDDNKDERVSSSRRDVMFGLLAVGFSTLTPGPASGHVLKKKVDEVELSTASSSSTIAAGGGSPGFVPLSILLAGTTFSTKSLLKNNEYSSESSLYVEPVPYGMREGRNYWNGIELAAARTASKPPTSSSKNTTELFISKTPQEKNPLTPTSALSASSTNISDAYFISSTTTPLKENTQELVNQTKTSIASPLQPSTASLKSLLVNTNSVTQISKPSNTTTLAKNNDTVGLLAIPTSLGEDELSEDDMLLKALREAEEAELCLREAEAEAARIDEELANLGISTSSLILPMKDEMGSSQGEKTPRQDIEQDIKVMTPNKNTFEAAKVPETSQSKPTDQPLPSKTTDVSSNEDTSPEVRFFSVQPTEPQVFSKLAGSLPQVSRVTRSKLKRDTFFTRPVTRTANLKDLLKTNTK
jgi:hypothetical protein